MANKNFFFVFLVISVFLVLGCGQEDYEETYEVAKRLSQKGPLTDTEYVRHLETSDELLKQITSIKIRASNRQHYVLRNLLDHYENLEMWRKAASVAERLTQLQPTKEQWHVRLGRVHARLSQVDEDHIEPAQRAFRTALEINPDSVQANYGLGVLHGFHAGNPDKGRRFLRQAAYKSKVNAKTRPYVVEARFALGKLEFQQDKWEAAREAFEKILDLESISRESRFLALKNVGDVYRSRNSNDLAKKYYQRAYDIEPTDSAVRSRLRSLGVTVEDRFNRFE